LAQHRPSEHVGQEHVERDRGRLVLLGKVYRVGASDRDQHLEAVVAREIDHHPRIMRIVFHDQQDIVPGLDAEPIVGDRAHRMGLRQHRRVHRERVRAEGRVADADRVRRADISGRQIQREGAAAARRAAQLDLAAEQLRQFAADGEAEAGTAVFSAGAGIGLLERLEDDLLLFERNADAGVGHLERDHARRLLEHGMLRVPAGPRGDHAHPDATLGGELESIGQQVLQHLLQPLGVGDDAAPDILVDLNVEGESAVFRLVAERPPHHIQQRRERDVLGVDGHGAGLDLREIENVADEVQQVGAGGMDGARELDLLA
jgi:hypothetical protein